MKWMRFWKATAVFTGLILALAACTTAEELSETAVANPTAPPLVPTVVQPTGQPVLADLPDLGAAPEIRNELWVNADEPVTLAASRGKVVLLEFWTFG